MFVPTEKIQLRKRSLVLPFAIARATESTSESVFNDVHCPPLFLDTPGSHINGSEHDRPIDQSFSSSLPGDPAVSLDDDSLVTLTLNPPANPPINPADHWTHALSIGQINGSSSIIALKGMTESRDITKGRYYN